MNYNKVFSVNIKGSKVPPYRSGTKETEEGRNNELDLRPDYK